MKRVLLRIGDMTCVGCETTLTRVLSAVEGVEVLSADFTRGEVLVTCEAPATAGQLRVAVQDSGYTLDGIDELAFEGDVSEANERQAGQGSAAGRAESAHVGMQPSAKSTAPDLTVVYLLVIVVGLYVIASKLGLLSALSAFPTVGTQQVGYLALFGIGLLTSTHCIAMCGGINLAQSVAGRSGHPLRRAGLYNAGRLASYTLIGGLLGLAGSAIALTTQMRAAVGVAAGVAMVVVGIGLVGRFSFMRVLAPKLPAPLARGAGRLAGKGSFAVGLVNGFMPCGPLQAMQLYAIASGGFLAGASSMFAFCLGTIPLMFAFSGIAGALKAAAKRVMTLASSAVIMLLGLVLAFNSLSIFGVSVPWLAGSGASEDGYVVSTLQLDGTQRVVTQLREDGYDNIQVVAGTPVVWVIEATEDALNGCNNQIELPAFDQEVTLEVGENVIEFTPEEVGTYSFSCWMGMLHGTVEVVES